MDADARNGAPGLQIEDVLAGAMWVSNLTDPALSIDRLHETFLDVIFSVPVASKPKEAGGDDDGQHRRMRTAAEIEKERRDREKLRREADELLGIGQPAGDDDAFLEDEDEDEEDFDEIEELEDDGEFLSWIDHTQQVTHKGLDEEGLTADDAIEYELERVGLGEAEQRIAADMLPERLQEIATHDRRPKLGSVRLPRGYSYTIPLEQEAYWILRQLRNTGQPLAHNPRVCTLANRAQGEVAADPILRSIAYALEKMTREFMEPAHLMMYHQTELHPLLHALLDASPLLAAAEHSFPVASLAYSSLTGRRQRPLLTPNFVGFSATCKSSIGEGDPMWRRLTTLDTAVRKPCFVELGRLLVRILELDSLCHNLESRRQKMLLTLSESTEAHVQEQRALLEKIVFEDAVEADLWQSFVQALTFRGQRGAYHQMRERGLEEAFEEYTITSLQYQENLLGSAASSLCSQPPQIDVYAWAEQVGATMTPPRPGSWVLSLFNRAIVDSFTKLPLLAKQVFEVFCTEGDLIVSYVHVEKPDDIFPLASFFTSHPRHYLELLQKEGQGSAVLSYVLDEGLVRRILNTNRLYQPLAMEGTTDAQWYHERQTAIDRLIYSLIDDVIPHVKKALVRQTTYQLDASFVDRLGLLCSQGPFEKTRLALEAYDDSALTWEPEWNVVEALPTQSSDHSSSGVSGIPATLSPKQQFRVCAAFQDDGGITSFVFVDENGTVRGTTRWVDCAMNSPQGRKASLMQHINLEKMFQQCTPSVIAVAASRSGSLRLMRTMQDFVRDRISGTLGVDVTVIWAPPEIARFSSETSFARQDAPAMDAAMRTCVALARYVQDPLDVIGTLFDDRKTIARMFLAGFGGTVATLEHEKELFRRLAWEMSLWVGATGLWLGDCVRRPNSVAVLQFVPGLGLSKARVLHQNVVENPIFSRLALAQRMSELFGDRVAENGASAIRVSAPDAGDDGAAMWHLMDQTLVPLQWYDVAEAVADVLAKGSGDEALVSAAVPLMALTAKDTATRRGVAARTAKGTGYISEVRRRLMARGHMDAVPTHCEYTLITDEVVHGGQSTMRRPYRRISTRELMVGVTGVTYVSQTDIVDVVRRGLASSSILGSAAAGTGESLADSRSLGSFIIKEGDYITGTVIGVRGGNNAGIRLTTSRGIDAFISMDNVDDELRRAELEQHVGFLESAREARKRGTPLSSTVIEANETPSWLRRGSLIQGVAARCSWGRCELLLRWCPPKEAGLGSLGGENGTTKAPIPYASLVGRSLYGSDAPDAESQWKDAFAFTTKISRHVLFRDFGMTRAEEELRDKEIGEVLLRPASRNRSKTVCVVKLGLNCTGSWLVSEQRRANGNIYYVIKDGAIKETFTFDEVDELLTKYIAKVVELVKDVRKHRRFVDNANDVSRSLEDQLAGTGGRGFAYCFLETGMGSRPPLYRVCTRGGGVSYRFRLHFTNQAIFVRLPLARSERREGDAEYRWVRCGNAEQVSQTVKNHARSAAHV